jgi:hypothetical protein
MDPKADEGGASEDSGQEKSEQGSEEEIGDVDGDDSEEEASENQPTPVASRVRLRSGGDSDSARAVKRRTSDAKISTLWVTRAAAYYPP